MKSSQLSIYIIVGIVCSFKAMGMDMASGPVTQVSLRSAVDQALKENPGLGEVREKVNEIDANVSQVRSLLYPTLNATATAYQKKDQVQNGNPLFGGDPYNSYVADLKLNQPLMQIGSLAAINAAKRSLDVKTMDLEIATRNIIVNTISGYFKVIVNSRALDTLNKQQKIVKNSLAVAQSREKTGRGQLLDVLQVKTQLAVLDSQISTAKNDLSIAIANLSVLMGKTHTEEFHIEDKMETPHLTDVDSMVDVSKARIPEVYRDQYLLSQLDEQRQVLWGQNLPSLALIGDYNFLSYKRSDLFDSSANAWYLGLQLTIPLFSGLSSFDQRRALGSQKLQAQYNLKNIENQLSLQQVTSRKNLESAVQAIESGSEALRLAKASSDEASKNYRYATIDFVNFLSVQKEYILAEQTLDRYKFNYVLALADYYSVSGQDLMKFVDMLEKLNK
jgi:outer membrane protein